MKKPSWKETQELLGQMQAPESGQDRETFWRTFQARAASLPRDQVVEAPRPVIAHPWRLALGAAAAIALIVAIIVMPAPEGGSPIEHLAAQMNTVQSIEVTAPHSGVLILNDEASGGTIVWIADMTTPSTANPGATP